MEQDELVNIERNLQVILEDLKTVTSMMEDRQPCNQVLHKIGTIQRALRVLGYSLIACRVGESIASLQNNPDPDARIIEIVRLQDLYKEMIRTPYLK